MPLQATGQGRRPPVAAAAAAAADRDPAQLPASLSGTGCPKRIAAAGFPDDAVVEILSRLPAKSLCRSKCVSKDWCQLISGRLRCGKLPQALEGFFYGCVDGFLDIGCDNCYANSSEDSNENGFVDIGCDNFYANSSEDSNESGSEDSGEGRNDDANEGGWGDTVWGEAGGECGSKDEELPQIYGHFINLSGIPAPLVDPLFSSLRKQPGIRSLTLLDSCNGLLLFGRPHIFITRSYIVYNPATEHLVPVHSSGDKYRSVTWEDVDIDNDWDPCVSTYLIFDPVVSLHFQLIEFFEHFPYVVAVYTYSSETGEWSNVASLTGEWSDVVYTDTYLFEWDLRKTIKSMRGSTIFNRMLHLIVSPSRLKAHESELIAAINGKGETCRVISWPRNRGFPIFVGQSKGLLHCLSVSGHPDGNSCHMATELSIWVLKDYGAEEWELKHTVSFLELFGKQSCQFGSDYNVVTLHPEHNLIFFVHHGDYKLVSYDMDCKEMHALCTVGCDYGLVTPYVPYFSETPVLSKEHSKEALCNCHFHC